MTPLIRAGRKAGRTMTILFSAALLSTCGFLTDDIFPRWLTYVEASVDFRSIAVAQGLGADAYIENLELAPYVIGANDYSKVLVYANGNSTSKLLLLDPESLEHIFTPPFTVGFSRALASVSNGFMCGTQVINPQNPGDAPSATPAWNSPEAKRVFRLGDPVTGYNYAVDPYPSRLGADFREYDPGMNLTANIASRNWHSAGIDTYDVLDAELVNGLSVLASRYGYQAYATSYASSSNYTDILITSVFDSAAVTQTGPFPVSENYAWLTEGGPVAFSHGDSGSDRLVRYSWGTGDFATGAQAEEIDSMDFEDQEDIKLLSFDPSGTWWFMYDRMDGRLYKLRTWWK